VVAALRLPRVRHATLITSAASGNSAVAVYLAVVIWFSHMKTTLNLDDELVRRAKRRAAEQGTTLTAVIEDALRAALSEPARNMGFKLRLVTVRGERPPRIDPADRGALYDFLDTEGAPE
jgi:plasmid stability protein